MATRIQKRREKYSSVCLNALRTVFKVSIACNHVNFFNLYAGLQLLDDFSWLTRTLSIFSFTSSIYISYYMNEIYTEHSIINMSGECGIIHLEIKRFFYFFSFLLISLNTSSPFLRNITKYHFHNFKNFIFLIFQKYCDNLNYKVYLKRIKENYLSKVFFLVKNFIYIK